MAKSLKTALQMGKEVGDDSEIRRATDYQYFSKNRCDVTQRKCFAYSRAKHVFFQLAKGKLAQHVRSRNDQKKIKEEFLVENPNFFHQSRRFYYLWKFLKGNKWLLTQIKNMFRNFRARFAKYFFQ